MPRRVARFAKTLNAPLVIGGGLLLLLLIGALAAPLLSAHDPNEAVLLRDASGGSLAPPYPPGTPGMPLGSDTVRRDQWSRLLYGARYTLLFAGIAMLLRMLIGTALGMLAGWYRGLARLVEVLTITWSAVPSLFFALGLILLFFRGADLFAGTVLYLVAVSCTGWAEIAVRCRVAVQSMANAAFIEAAYVIGRSRAAVLWRHMLPNLRDLLLVEAAYAAAAVLLLIGELGFLGLYLGTPEIGVSPTGLQADPIYAEWGSMLAVGLRQRGQGWWLLLEPAIALSLAILAFALLAEGLRRRR